MRSRAFFLLWGFIVFQLAVWSGNSVAIEPPQVGVGPSQQQAGQARSEQMTVAEKLAVAEDMLDAWTRLDWERVYALFGDDGVLHNMMLEPTVGGAAIRERLGKFDGPLTRMDFIILRMGILNGEVVIERIDSFDFNGHSADVPVTGVLRIEDGQVKEWREYYDLNWLRLGMGAEGEPPHPLSPVEPIAPDDEMSDEEKLAVARAMLDAYESLDWEKAASLIADDGVIHYVEKEPMVGPEAMRAHLARVGPGLSRVKFDIRNIGIIDGVVMLERIDDLYYRDRHVAIPVYGTMEIADHKIKVWREYYDHAQMRRGMGLAE